MSVKLNSIANFTGVGISSVTALVTVPFLIQYFDAESFGLIGFFFLAQAWFALFDLGFSQVVLRAAALSREQSANDFRRLFGSVEVLFIAIALALLAGCWSGASWISGNWLKITELDAGVAQRSVLLIGCVLAVRFVAGVYRSCLLGLELQVRVNVVTATSAILRYPIVYVLISSFQLDLTAYFISQVAVSLGELGFFAVFTYRSLPGGNPGVPRLRLEELRKSLPFALSVAYSALLSAVLVQVDRFALSGSLSIEAVGFLATVFLVTAGLGQLGGPITQAILPRLTALSTDPDRRQFFSLYLNGAEILGLVLGPLTIVIAVFPFEVLYVWTASIEAANWGATPLRWYALGNLALAFATGPYMLLYARGNLLPHVRYISFVALFQTPLLVVLAIYFDVAWVARVWCALRFVDLFLWGWFVHNKLVAADFYSWLRRSFAAFLVSSPITLPVSAVLAGLELDGRAMIGVVLVCGLALCLLVAVSLSQLGRQQVREVFRQVRH